MNTPSIWSQKILEEAKDKIAEDGLLNLALETVFEDTGALNDIAISSMLMKARRMNKDGRKFLWMALNQKYGNAAPTPEAIQSQKSGVNSGLKCPVCNKEFKSQAALSGHGVNRCKG